MIRQDSAGWEDCKTEEELEKLHRRDPNRYQPDPEGRWHCPPGEAHATEHRTRPLLSRLVLTRGRFGLTSETFSSWKFASCHQGSAGVLATESAPSGPAICIVFASGGRGPKGLCEVSLLGQPTPVHRYGPNIARWPANGRIRGHHVLQISAASGVAYTKSSAYSRPLNWTNLWQMSEAMALNSFSSFGRGFDSHRPLDKSC